MSSTLTQPKTKTVKRLSRLQKDLLGDMRLRELVGADQQLDRDVTSNDWYER